MAVGSTFFLISHMYDRIVFWEPTESPHKSGLLNALSVKLPSTEILCFAQKAIAEDRRALGWADDSIHRFATKIAPTAEEIRTVFSHASPRTFHIFSGIRHVPIIVQGLSQALKMGSQFAILSEPRVMEGWLGALRVVQSLMQERKIARDCSLVLAIGANAPRWFSRVGYRSESIIPFAYFVPAPQGESEAVSLELGERDGLRIGYLGRLSREKGVLDLIPAVSRAKSKCSLDIVGFGEMRAPLLKQSLESCKQIRLHNAISMRGVSDFLQQLDILILPSNSTNDGWGVVVSEALMNGTQVIVTSCVGASLAVSQHAIFGRIVDPNSPRAIADAIDALASENDFSPSTRLRRAVLAQQLLSAEAGAGYLSNLLSWVCDGGEKPAEHFAHVLAA